MTAQTFTGRIARASAEFSALQIALLFAVFAMISIIPLLTQTMPPLEDYANHLSRMHVIADHGRDPVLSRFYEIDWEMIPDLMMDLIVPVLVKVTNIYLAGRLFIIGIFVLIMSGTFALNRALFGRWSVLPLIAFPLLYNYVFLVGVLNYLFGVGLALWALAAWVGLRERHWALRYAISFVFAFALYFCHLYAVGVYGLGLLAFEIRYLLRNRARRPLGVRLLAFAAAGLPFLPLLPILLESSTWSHVLEYEWEPRGKIDGLMYVIEIYSDVGAFVLTGIVAVCAVWAARRRALRINSYLLFCLGVATIVYLALPRMMFATYMADQRLPVAVAFMLVACFQIELKEEASQRLFLLVSLVLLAGRVIEVDATWGQKAPLTMELRESLKRIHRGATVLVAYADENGDDELGQLGLVHAACLAIIERSALVTTAFTVKGKQIMHVRPEFRRMVDTDDGTPPTVDQLVLDAMGRPTEGESYWEDWKTKFDYVYVLFTDSETENPMPEILKPVYEGELFHLYRILKKPAAPVPGTPSEGPAQPAEENGRHGEENP